MLCQNAKRFFVSRIILIKEGLIMKSVGVLIATLLALVALSGCLGGNDSDNKDTSAAREENISGELSVNSVRALLSSDEADGASIEVNNGQVNITRKMAENLNNEMMVDGARIDTIDILKDVFQDERVSSVMVTSGVHLTDKYGQTTYELGSVYLMSRDTYEKISWDKFLFKNLDDVADKHYINPVLRN